MGVIRQNDPTFAQLIERATKSSDLVASQSNLQAIMQYVHSRPSCSDRTNDDTGRAPKPAHPNKYFLAFVNNFKQRQIPIQELLQERLPKWTEDPFSFWGRVDPLSQLSLPTALRRLCVHIENFDEEITVSPIRRRLSLARLNEFREVIEIRIEYLARSSQIKVKRGATYKSISIDVLSTLACETSGKVNVKSKLLSRLRAGERYSRLQIGMLLALGDVPFDGMERCSWDEFEIIAQYCDTVSPDFILELGKVATVLKKAIWDSELNFTELDLIITSLLSPTSHPHKEPISHRQSERPSKRNSESYGQQNKKQCRDTQIRLDETITPYDTRDGDLRESTQDEQRLQSWQDTNNSMGITNHDDNASDTTPPSHELLVSNNHFPNPATRYNNNGNTYTFRSGSYDFDPHSTTRQEADSWFDDDPAALIRLGSDERRSVEHNDNSAALPGMGQEFAFTFIDDPAALVGMSQEFPFHFVDDPAATLSTSDENLG